MTPTPEQATIIDAARQTSDNLIILALAGAAKTTTLELICRTVTGIPILSLAFNKRIADEMTKRLPSHVECRTMNSLGHRVWGAAIGKRLSLDTQKMSTILKNLIDALPRDAKTEAYDDFADTLKWLRYAKRDGWVPRAWGGTGKAIVEDFETFAAQYDEIPSPQQKELITSAMNASIEAAYAGAIDFDDQIYMPVIFGGSWPRFPLVLVDEAQDLSPLNHAMLEKLVSRRIIAVGDPWQSIYGFRGAVANGMAALRERFDMKELPLSVTFRVPRAGVERAHFRAPHMRAPEWAKEGRIEVLNEWSEADVPDGAAIICRNNAPLFSCALRLLADGRNIKLVGMDIGPQLLRTMRKLGPETLTNFDLAINQWIATELKRARRPDIVYEKADCLRVLTQGRATLKEAILYAEDLFKRDGPIQLLSGHKAKGLEWETVLHLDPWRIPSPRAREGTEEYEQELNVRYVIETRFKEELFLVDMEGYA